jgi:hypothetical protein
MDGNWGESSSCKMLLANLKRSDHLDGTGVDEKAIKVILGK